MLQQGFVSHISIIMTPSKMNNFPTNFNEGTTEQGPKVSENTAIVNRTGFVVTMGQITFTEAEYQNKKRKTRREIFLEQVDKLVPWKQLEK